MSARRANGERLLAEQNRRIAEAGGPIKVDELRTALRRTDLPAPGRGHNRDVWTFRGRDWRICVNPDQETYAAYPYHEWQQDPDSREWVPMTSGANKWMREALHREELTA